MSAAHAIELSSVPTLTLDCKLPNSESKYTSLSLLQEEIERVALRVLDACTCEGRARNGATMSFLDLSFVRAGVHTCS